MIRGIFSLLFILATVEPARAALQCSSVFSDPVDVAVEADKMSRDLLRKQDLAESKPAILLQIEKSFVTLQERRAELVKEQDLATSVYMQSAYKISEVIKAIDEMLQVANQLTTTRQITYKEYFLYFFRLSAVLSFLPTAEIQKIYDAVGDLLSRGDPSYTLHEFVKNNFDSFAPFALTGKLNTLSPDILKVYESDKTRMFFMYEMPSLELLTRKMAKGIVYATITDKPSSFDGSPLLFPYDLAKHDVVHAARFIDALERNGLDLDRYVKDNQTILARVQSELTINEQRFFWSFHFNRNHEGSYPLTYINEQGAFSWIGTKEKDILVNLKLNPPEGWHMTEGQAKRLLSNLRRKGFL